ncbi:amidohydrolase family protein [Acidovorax sp. BLS4]|uniref:amidohydrolase family protein n=1 Tax=Acidovorax sp. BLS4 TaxID=3273430 RepID=UPI00294212A1|nr:amidohydrolase family protein [Paracidovorax avenae]WOI45670.1 amidohydrolase family protein [Paracidovorax avenae]
MPKDVDRAPHPDAWDGAGACWDAHVHVFDADAPTQPGHYRPAHHPLERIEGLAAAHGVRHLVLVQPSVYGTDNAVMLSALAARPGRHRGVAVVDAAVPDALLDRMHALGVRGVRFNRVSPVGNGPEAFRALAPRLRERGWHVQWYAGPEHLAEIAALHDRTGVACVLDHLAGLHAELPADDAAWSALAALAAQGAWIKLSGWYRLRAQAPYGALQETVRRVADLAPGRLVWGSDWPHTSFAADAMPAYASVWQPVVEALGPDRAGTVRQNASRLYA